MLQSLANFIKICVTTLQSIVVADGSSSSSGFLFGMPTSPKTSSFSFSQGSTPVSATTADSTGTPGFKFGVSPADVAKASEEDKNGPFGRK